MLLGPCTGGVPARRAKVARCEGDLLGAKVAAARIQEIIEEMPAAGQKGEVRDIRLGGNKVKTVHRRTADSPLLATHALTRHSQPPDFLGRCPHAICLWWTRITFEVGHFLRCSAQAVAQHLRVASLPHPRTPSLRSSRDFVVLEVVMWRGSEQAGGAPDQIIDGNALLSIHWMTPVARYLLREYASNIARWLSARRRRRCSNASHVAKGETKNSREDWITKNRNNNVTPQRSEVVHRKTGTARTHQAAAATRHVGTHSWRHTNF